VEHVFLITNLHILGKLWITYEIWVAYVYTLGTVTTKLEKYNF
jgi:hypothetical protein